MRDIDKDVRKDRKDTVDEPEFVDQHRPFEPADAMAEPGTTGRDVDAGWQDDDRNLAAEPLPVDETVPPVPADNTTDNTTDNATDTVPPVPVERNIGRGQNVVAGTGDVAAPFAGDAVERFRARWRELQADFVDDPKRAVSEADDVLDEVMRTLTEHRQRLASEWKGQTDTEDLRIALREYRSFFDQLLPT